jgi:hypothetical protein
MYIRRSDSGVPRGGEEGEIADRCALRCVTVSQAQNAQCHGTTYTASASSGQSFDRVFRDDIVSPVASG